MRIAQIAPLAESVPPKLYGGTERVVAWLVDELVSLGHEVTLFASGDSRTRGKLHPVWPRALRLGRPTADPAVARPVNRLVIAGPNGELHRYDKIHPFSFAGEHDHYAAGSSFLTVDVEGVRVTGFVCYDLRFADEWWAVARDTDCYAVVANWPASRRHHWRSLLMARAIENQAYVVGVNRVGVDGNGLEYAGDSMVIDPMGEVLASGAGGETIVLADVDSSVVADVRARLPFLADRRR